MCENLHAYLKLIHWPPQGLFGAKFPQATETIGPQINTNRDIFPEKCDASATRSDTTQPMHTTTEGHSISTEVTGDEAIQTHEVETLDSEGFGSRQFAICKGDMN